MGLAMVMQVRLAEQVLLAALLAEELLVEPLAVVG